MTAPEPAARWRTPAALGWAALLALAILGPALRPGYLLVGDMVFVPEQPWKLAWLGLDGSVPRAVPSDVLTWAATNVLPGDLVQKLVLVSTLVIGGLGAARLVGSDRILPRAAAIAFFVWNPFVAERLAIGHWALLCGYAALPWVVDGARRLRDHGVDLPRVAGLAFPLAVAAFTSPTGGLLATAAAVVVVALGRRPGPVVAALALGLVLNLPWILPGVLNAADQLPPDPFGVEAFAARADTPWGVLGSLLTLGGLWKESVEPGGRGDLLLSGMSLLLTGLGLVGLWLGRRTDRATTVAVAGLAVAGTVLAWLPALGWGAEAFEWLVVTVPGAGILRDSQKWVAPLALLLAVGLGRLVAALLDHRDDVHSRVWGAAVAVLPVLALPGLAWGFWGDLRPASYPSEWEQVRATMEAERIDEGRTLALPFSIYRRYEWNDERAVLDPAPRFFPGQLITDDDLGVRSGTVGGESRTARTLGRALGTPAEAEVLADEGVGWALVQKDVPGYDATVIPTGRVLHDGPHLLLVEVGEPAEPERTPGAAVVAPVSVAVLLLGAASGLVLVARKVRLYWLETPVAEET